MRIRALALAVAIALALPLRTSRGEDAEALYKRGAYAEAAKAFEDELASRRTVPLLVACGNCYVRTGAYEKAIERYREALRLEPANREAQRNLGRAFYRAGRYAEAGTALAQGLGEASDPDELRLLASALALADDAQGAVLALERAAFVLPSDARVRQELGRAYARAGRATDAVRAFRSAIAKDPSDLTAWQPLGQASLQGGQRDDAIVALEVASRLDAVDRAGLALLADLELESGLAPAAARAYERAIAASDRPDAEDLERLGLARLRAGEPDRALDALDRSIASSPRALARVYRARALDALGKRAEARAELEAVAGDPNAGAAREAARSALAALR